MLSSFEAGLRKWSWLAQADISNTNLWLLLFGLLLLVWGSLRLLRRRKPPQKAIRACAIGALLCITTLVYVILRSQWQAYPVLFPEREILEISFERQADTDQYDVTLVGIPAPGNKRMPVVPTGRWVISGQEWRLTVRQISGTAHLSLRPRYRFHRLVTRSRQIKDAPEEPHRAYVLRTRPDPDLWRMVKENPQWFPGISVRVVTTDYMPIEDGAKYRFSLSGDAVIARRMANE